MREEGKKLIIVVEMDQDFGPSKSGKTRIIATTEGNIFAPGDEEVNLRHCAVYRDYFTPDTRDNCHGLPIHLHPVPR